MKRMMMLIFLVFMLSGCTKNKTFAEYQEILENNGYEIVISGQSEIDKWNEILIRDHYATEPVVYRIANARIDGEFVIMMFSMESEYYSNRFQDYFIDISTGITHSTEFLVRGTLFIFVMDGHQQWFE